MDSSPALFLYGRPAGMEEFSRRPCVWGALEPGVCASFRCGFAPHTRESLILPLRGANFLPGKATGGRGGLRLTPGKALFFRRGAQTGFPGAGAELVHGTPQSHDFPFPLHQVVGLFRRLTASELVHGTP